VLDSFSKALHNLASLLLSTKKRKQQQVGKRKKAKPDCCETTAEHRKVRSDERCSLKINSR
jgi:hypothetical protein